MQRPGHASAANIAELMSDYLGWDCLMIQELAIRHDDGDTTHSLELMDQGHIMIMITNKIKKWDTAAILHRCWADKEWEIRETPSAVIITRKDSATKRLTVVSTHIPEAWHHSDEE